MRIQTRIKDLEQMEAAIKKEKEALLVAGRKQKAARSKLRGLLKQSDFDKPRDLVEALIEEFSLRGFSSKKRKAASAGKTVGGRRRRTKVTPEIRDMVKNAVKGGASKNAVSKDTNISYAVITKIVEGKYDKLKG